MIESIILAAGKGMRAGGPKALLRIHDTTFLELIMQTLHSSGISRIIIVASPESLNSLLPIANFADANLLINTDDNADQLSSIRAGMTALSNESAGFICWPVDIPLANTDTIQSLISLAGSSDKSILIPRYQNKRGHPVIFMRKTYQNLLTCPHVMGARWIIHNSPDEVQELEVEDSGILCNINTPDDLKKIQ